MFPEARGLPPGFLGRGGKVREGRRTGKEGPSPGCRYPRSSAQGAPTRRLLAAALTPRPAPPRSAPRGVRSARWADPQARRQQRPRQEEGGPQAAGCVAAAGPACWALGTAPGAVRGAETPAPPGPGQSRRRNSISPVHVWGGEPPDPAEEADPSSVGQVRGCLGAHRESRAGPLTH